MPNLPACIVCGSLTHTHYPGTKKNFTTHPDCGTTGLHYGASQERMSGGKHILAGWLLYHDDQSQHYCTAKEIPAPVRQSRTGGRPQPIARPPQVATTSEPVDMAPFKQELGQLRTDVDALAPVIQAIDSKVDTLAKTEDIEAARQDLADAVAKLQVARPIELTVEGVTHTLTGRQHYMFLNLVATVNAVKDSGIAYLVGEAGSFKSSAGPMVADVLGQGFRRFTCDPLMDRTDVFGYHNANGQGVDPWGFAAAFRDGDLMFVDELDAASAVGGVSLNVLTTDRRIRFAIGEIDRHPKFALIAAGNTFGRGADSQYVGRSQLDAATLSRMVYLPWNTDWELLGESLGMKVKGDAPEFPPPGPARKANEYEDWLTYVKCIRDKVQELRIEAVVSSRAVINGAKLLAAGLDRKLVEYATIWANLSELDRATVESSLKGARA